ncbi:uncharacterized protein HMPREF1541_02540 [Cyphellophora europaea CBS 101466]|uniref:Carbohydrate kinase PfkB domain-containing protein n=1 Tax=Cyphellophora europaea (strain CBS 101466) TaxID=1220924 RepID=W2S3W7_CYPE1|nr:uncharacterized protein HMPREF1541_02540 [Cyphellophora europaea CBS 101466]ETN43381.1 hypothetical protein HMPREF1541_02540 [Cyphellophora europaea CBS 101466]
MKSRLGFCTFGMFIIDEIDYGDGKVESTIIGGGGLYAALGARLASGEANARAVSCIVDKGSDFPQEFQALIETWGTSCIFRTDLGRLTTRAWNGYGPIQHRAFKYVTLKRRLEVESLTDEQALAATFHMVCSPSRCMSLVNGLWERRKALHASEPRPIIIWEPIPDLCTPAEVDNLREAAKFVNVISPNGGELADFFASGLQELSRRDMVASLLKKCGDNAKQVVVVREGAEGSRLYTQGKVLHLRAYHLDPSRVLDPTGGGNTFLGGLAMGLSGMVNPDFKDMSTGLGLVAETCPSQTTSMLTAVVHATVAASYAIEQVGVPRLDPSDRESWNGQSYIERFHAYLGRERPHIVDQLD